MTRIDFSIAILLNHELPMWLDTVAAICLIWYIAVVIVCALGYLQIKRYYSSRPPKSISASLPIHNVPHVTVIRPVKGLEPHLYSCLAAAFRQDYPIQKLTIRLCVSSREDPAFSILEHVVADFPHFDAQVLVEEEDPVLRGERDSGEVQDERILHLGPNPKIRNMSRAYREAKGDIIWIIDCNVWVGKGACGRMVDKLCGLSAQGSSMPYKFVHHLPLVVDVEDLPRRDEMSALLQGSGNPQTDFTSPSISTLLSTRGGRLEELFLSSSHAKFYTAINTVLIAPCIVGKSNMFRRSHLDYLTSLEASAANDKTISKTKKGIDFFSDNICEDHLIGDLLWRRPVPAELPPTPTKYGKHALVFGDLAIQPMANMSVSSYIARRIRWLRVRKFTVTLATLVEPGTESLLCSAYGAFGLTALPWCNESLGIPRTWTAFFSMFFTSVLIWCIVDWTLYILLHSASSIELDTHTPIFAQPPRKQDITRRNFPEWLSAWLGRELLAFPIWYWAVWGGVNVTWRDRRFWVGMDMRVHEIGGLDRKNQVGSIDHHGLKNGVPGVGSSHSGNGSLGGRNRKKGRMG